LQFPFRRGITLLEVLISTFVLAIGLLGLAALLPVGRLAIMETLKADHSGDCGRAGLRDVKVRRMLDPDFWPAGANVGNGSFVIDPVGVVTGAGDKFGGVLPRISLMYGSLNGVIPYDLNKALQVFLWADDLQYDMPEDLRPPQPAGRPVLEPGMYLPRYSWFVTATPAAAQANLMPNERTHYNASIVICNNRPLAVGMSAADVADIVVGVSSLPDSINGVSPGGGSIVLSDPITNAVNGKNLRENNWIALVSPATATRGPVCCWYRVVSVGDPTTHLALSGPDWVIPAAQTQAIVPSATVIGVYTTIVEVDRNPTWMQ
jgi:hypothetical protein